MPITLEKRRESRRSIIIETRRGFFDEVVRKVHYEQPRGSIVIEDEGRQHSDRPYNEAALQTIGEVIGLLDPVHGTLRVGNENYYGRSTDALVRDVVLVMLQHGTLTVKTLSLYSRYPNLINRFLRYVQIGSLKNLEINFGNTAQARFDQLTYLRAHIPHLESLTVHGNLAVPLHMLSHLQHASASIQPFQMQEVNAYKLGILERGILREHRLVVSHPEIERVLIRPQERFEASLNQYDENSAVQEFTDRGFYEFDEEGLLPDWIFRFNRSENEFLMISAAFPGVMMLKKQVVDLAQIGRFD
ncbi:unnamed protein product [Caenorhabditis brenneri]